VSRKRLTGEQIIGLLLEADVKLSQGRQVGQTCRDMGITEQTYYVCRNPWPTYSRSHLPGLCSGLALGKLVRINADIP
jgi:hypothetical protein